jgi:hypothetical protein
MLESSFTFSDGQSVATLADGSSLISTNVAKIKDVLKDAWGNSKAPEIGGLCLAVQVKTVLVGSTSKLDVDLYTHSTATVTSGKKIAGIQIPAESAAGWRGGIQFVPGTEVDEYIGVVFTARGNTITSSAIDASLGAGSEFIYP